MDILANELVPVVMATECWGGLWPITFVFTQII